MPLSPPSEIEAISYYSGLPSTSFVVARTGTMISWEKPAGLEAYRRYRDLRVVGNHVIKDVWEDNLAFKLHALLDSMDVKWTSTDVVRLGYDEEDSAPVILWIGVIPASLCSDDGIIVVSECHKLLGEYNITDVDVEIRESVVTHSAGPKFLTFGPWYDPAAEVCDPFTTTLGLPICAQSTPWAEGTGGFFITEGGKSERLLLVTARHTIFPRDGHKNELFRHKDDIQCHHKVTLFSDLTFDNYLKSLQDEIEGKEFNAEHRERCIKTLEGGESSGSERAA